MDSFSDNVNRRFWVVAKVAPTNLMPVCECKNLGAQNESHSTSCEKYYYFCATSPKLDHAIIRNNLITYELYKNTSSFVDVTSYRVNRKISITCASFFSVKQIKPAATSGRVVPGRDSATFYLAFLALEQCQSFIGMVGMLHFQMSQELVLLELKKKQSVTSEQMTHYGCSTPFFKMFVKPVSRNAVL
ncbi:uncharacterized protein LOC143449395 [Clavelina lepadiformis]|uniref:uncharacterized protein LOC143449395 n=1 Tax=Clavelina lepadiformis TaxID=159417 RepID=UPI0040429386